jgi:hypothetical protein
MRQAMLAAAADYCARTGMSRRALGQKIFGNPSFFFRLAKGENIMLSAVDKFRDWLLSHPVPVTPPRKSTSKKRRKTGISR